MVTAPLCQRRHRALRESTVRVGSTHADRVPYTRVDDPEKLRRLMEAVLMITADIELPDLLRHLVEEARSLVDARYGALGVLNEARTGLEQFLTVGLSDAEEEPSAPGRPAAACWDCSSPTPSLCGSTISRTPRELRIPGRAPADDLVPRCPLRVRDEVYGNLYLTDKEGATTFSDEDEALAEALALAAGIAIENTRLHDRVRVISVLDDRDRIARDLHDRVIQRIYAVGMTLQGATRLPDAT